MAATLEGVKGARGSGSSWSDRFRSLIAPGAKRYKPENIFHSIAQPSFIPLNRDNLRLENGASIHMQTNEGTVAINDGKLFVEYIPANGSVSIDMAALKQPEVIVLGKDYLKRYHGLGINGHPGHIFNIRDEAPRQTLTINGLQLDIWAMKNYLGDEGIAFFEREGASAYFRDAFIPDHISWVVRLEAGRATPKSENKEYRDGIYVNMWRLFMAKEASKMAFNLNQDANRRADVTDNVHALFEQTFALNMGTEEKPKIIRPNLKRFKQEQFQLAIPVQHEEKVLA